LSKKSGLFSLQLSQKAKAVTAQRPIFSVPNKTGKNAALVPHAFSQKII